MDNTLASNDVANENHLGYHVPLNLWTSDLKVVNPSLVCLFMFGGCGGLGFSTPSYCNTQNGLINDHN